MTHLTLANLEILAVEIISVMKLTEEESKCQNKVLYSYFTYPLDDRHETIPEALGPADIVVETRAKNCSKVL